MRPPEASGIHPQALVEPHVRLGADAVVGPFAWLGAGTSAPLVIGDGANVRSHTTIYGGNAIGRRFATGHGVLVRADNTIGDDVSIGSHSVVEHDVRIADGVRLHTGVFVPEFTVIEAGAWLGPRCVLTNARYPASRDAKRNLEGCHIGPRARVGANATLLPGIRIGAEALVGAGAVVTRDVPDGEVWVGAPARRVSRVMDIAAYSGGP